LDPDNTISESNESDNRAELAIRATESSRETRRTPVPVVSAAKNNYKISITNKKALEKVAIHPSMDVIIQGSLVNSGNKTLLRSNIPVSLVEENLSTHTSRTIYDTTVNLAPNATQNLKIHWNPIATGKMKLTLSINIPVLDAVPNDNKDQVILKVE
jgi:subtilase family serine protease